MMVLGKEGFEERRDLGSEFGTALICGLDGVVIQVLKADPGLVPIDPGDRLASWIDADCQDKLTSFFHSLQAAPQPGIWELILRDQDTVKPVFAAGLFSQELFLITLAGERSSSFQLLRSLSEELKEFAGINLPEDPRFLGRGSSEVDFFEELTRVNNQLISSQRLIQAQKAELAELNRLKDRFLGMAAHDLRNPLAAIMSYAEFLTDDLEGLISPEQEEFLSIIRSSSASR